jgi:arylsulfatase A-like enzyme
MPRTPHRFLFALLLGLAQACGETPSPAPETPSADASPPPNVLVFLVDTLRADHLGCYGYEKDTSPNIDAFAKEGTLYEFAWAAASSTSPSHGSIFTSTYPRVHGVWNRTLDQKGEPIFPRLADKAETMAESFQNAGYATVAITDGGNVTEARGCAQGFDHFDSGFRGVRDRVTTAKAWLEKRNEEQPFFMFLHTYQVHTPYIPESEFVEKFADPDYQGKYRTAWEGALEFSEKNQVKNAIRVIQQRFYKKHHPKEGEGAPNSEDLNFLISLYDAEIGLTDAVFGDLVAWMKEQELWENTVILVTSDHGEEFWEHGQYGHHQVYDHTLHVPFLVRTPDGVGGLRRPDNIELLDLMPSLLELCGIPIPNSVMGRALNFQSALPPQEDTQNVIGETNWPEEQVAFRTGKNKAMLFPNSNRRPEAYLLETDPGEHKNRVGTSTSQAFLKQVIETLETWRKLCADTRAEYGLAPAIRNIRQLSPERLAELQALGYVEW